jgi:hypothetical protein
MNAQYNRLVFLTVIIFLSLMTFNFSISTADESAGYYRINLVVETTSDWTSVKPLPPWNRDFYVAETKSIEPEEDPHFTINTKGVLAIRAPSHDSTKKKVEFTVYFKAQTQDMEFTITKGDIGTTRVKAVNTCSEKPYKIGTYTNSDSGGHTNLRQFKMSIKKISKYGMVDLPRK